MLKRGTHKLLFFVLILSLDDVLPKQLIGQGQKYDNSKRVTKILEATDDKCTILKENFSSDDCLSNKLLSTISIIGEFGTGKSFLLNFIVAYLKQGDVAFADNSNYEKVFSIEESFRPETTGIDMYNGYLPHPKRKLGVIALLDTEGTSDPEKPQKYAPTVSAIASYISSVLIYNIREKFTRSNTNQIQDLLRDMQKINKEKETHFQDLIIVFRDFPDPSFGFGVKGGEKYKKYIFGSDFKDDLLKSCFRQLQRWFWSVHFYLMPRPSNTVAYRRSPMSTVGDMEDREFLESVRELVKWTVNDLLVPRRLKTGQTLTVGTFTTELSIEFSKNDIEKAMNKSLKHYQEELYKQLGFFTTNYKRQQVHENLKQNATAQFEHEIGKLCIEKRYGNGTKVYLKLLIDEQFEVFNNSTMFNQNIALLGIVGVVIVGGAVAVKVYIPAVGVILLKEAKPFIVEGLKNAPNYIKL